MKINSIEELAKKNEKSERLEKSQESSKDEIKKRLGEVVDSRIDIYSTSAKSGKNIKRMFKHIAEQCYAKFVEQGSGSS